MKNFKLSEFFVSSAADKNGIKNEPSSDERTSVERNINMLVDNILDPIRDKLCAPVIITSGYRCPQVNKIVGGANNSQHISGCAADFHVRGFTVLMMWQVFLSIYDTMDFDQLIYYPNKNIIHVSYMGNGNRHEAFLKK